MCPLIFDTKASIFLYTFSLIWIPTKRKMTMHTTGLPCMFLACCCHSFPPPPPRSTPSPSLSSPMTSAPVGFITSGKDKAQNLQVNLPVFGNTEDPPPHNKHFGADVWKHSRNSSLIARILRSQTSLNTHHPSEVIPHRWTRFHVSCNAPPAPRHAPKWIPT